MSRLLKPFDTSMMAQNSANPTGRSATHSSIENNENTQKRDSMNYDLVDKLMNTSNSQDDDKD